MSIDQEPTIHPFEHLPLELTDWDALEADRQPGAAGHAMIKTRNYPGIRVRLVEYTPGYVADHWCPRAHLLFCIAGQASVEIKDGERLILRRGMTLSTGREAPPHRIISDSGAVLFIVD